MPALEILDSLDRIKWQVWGDDGLDEYAYETLRIKILRLSAQVKVLQVLQATARYLREPEKHPNFPDILARLVKFFNEVFSSNSESRLKEFEERWEKLRALDCATFLFIGISYTPLDITKMSRTEFDYLECNAAAFLGKSKLSPEWVFRPDLRLQIARTADLKNKKNMEFRKKYHTLEFDLPMLSGQEPDHQSNVSKAGMLDDCHSESATVSSPLTEVGAGAILASIKEKPQRTSSPITKRRRTNTKPEIAAEDGTEPSQDKHDGDVFIVEKDDAQQALHRGEDIYEVWLTNLKNNYNANDQKKRSFVTLWISEGLGKTLGKRSKLMRCVTNPQ